MATGRDDLGFAGLVMAGDDPQAAYAAIREQCADPEVRAIIAHLAATPDGQEALRWSRERWAAHGFPVPPWEDA